MLVLGGFGGWFVGRWRAENARARFGPAEDLERAQELSEERVRFGLVLCAWPPLPELDIRAVHEHSGGAVVEFGTRWGRPVGVVAFAQVAVWAFRKAAAAPMAR